MNHMRASFVAGAVDWAKVICKQSRSRKVYLDIQRCHFESSITCCKTYPGE